MSLNQWWLQLSLLDRHFKQIRVGQFELSFDGFLRRDYHDAKRMLKRLGGEIVSERFCIQTSTTKLVVRQPHL